LREDLLRGYGVFNPMENRFFCFEEFFSEFTFPTSDIENLWTIERRIQDLMKDPRIIMPIIERYLRVHKWSLILFFPDSSIYVFYIF
jgi:hypothetical protein